MRNILFVIQKLGRHNSLQIVLSLNTVLHTIWLGALTQLNSFKKLLNWKVLPRYCKNMYEGIAILEISTE